MIIKFNQAGRVAGRARESADEQAVEHPTAAARDRRLFRQPTDVAWTRRGISTSATATSTRGSPRSQRRLGQSWASEDPARPVQPPHAIVIDRNDNVYVGDRSIRRFSIRHRGRFPRMFTIDAAGAGHASRQRQHADRERLAATIGAPIGSASRRDRTRRCLSASTLGRLFKVALDGRARRDRQVGPPARFPRRKSAGVSVGTRVCAIHRTGGSRS
jgi:hypothetical protein